MESLTERIEAFISSGCGCGSGYGSGCGSVRSLFTI